MDNQAQIKTAMYDFHSQSSRLMRSSVDSFHSDLRKFLNYIDANPIISGYIKDCVELSLPEGYDAAAEVDSIKSSYGCIFGPFSDSDEAEAAEIYLVLKEISSQVINTRGLFFHGYANGSNKFQDMLKGFLDRVPYLLITHINDYLAKEAMAIEDRTPSQQIVFQGPTNQLNLATHGSRINAIQLDGEMPEDFARALQAVFDLSKTLEDEDRELVEDSLQQLAEETAAPAPRNGRIKGALSVLSGINGSAQFLAAVAQVTQFVQGFMM